MMFNGLQRLTETGFLVSSSKYAISVVTDAVADGDGVLYCHRDNFRDLGGHWLDGKINSSPLWLIIGLFLGIAVAALGVYNMIKPFIQEAKKPDNNKKDKDNK